MRALRQGLVSATLCCLALAACGDDEAAPPPPAGTPATPAAGAPSAAAKVPGKPLVPMVHIEDRVSCPTPTTAKTCDMKAPICGPGDYCLQAANGAFCGPCPERDGIRTAFKPRDFVPSENRDPFQSFVVTMPGLAPEPTVALVRDPSQVCVRKEQLVATSYSVRDLKLIGIVSQGTVKKALMLDNANLGNIIRKGDCVGKEKAFVRDIGQRYITFSISPDPTNAAQQNPEELSVKLYPDEVTLGGSVLDGGPVTTGPVIIAPSAGPTTVPGPNQSSAPKVPPPGSPTMTPERPAPSLSGPSAAPSK